MSKEQLIALLKSYRDALVVFVLEHKICVGCVIAAFIAGLIV